MNIEIKSVQPKPVLECDILVNGITIGRIMELDNSTAFKYHAVLDSKIPYGCIYQGFGNTHDEAMRDAIDKSKLRRVQEITELNKLEDLIWGDDEAN